MISGSTFLWVLVVVSAVCDWACVLNSSVRGEYVFKPLVLALLLLKACLARGHGRGHGLAPLRIALLLSLGGDIMLMLPDEILDAWAFMAGLLFFLTAHILFVLAHLRTSKVWRMIKQPAGLFGNVPKLVAVELLFAAFIIALAEYYASFRNPETTTLANVSSTMTYILVISSMRVSSLIILGSPNVPLATGRIIYVGAMLFFYSDSLLALDRFGFPLAFDKISAKAIVHALYHCAQFAMVWGTIAAAERTSGKSKKQEESKKAK